jgi:integrase
MSVPDWKASLALIKKDAPGLLATLVIAGFCGLRRSELMAQRWADIDLKRGHMRVTKAKRRTPARRLVSLCPAAKAWLALCDQEGDLIGPGWASDHVRARLRDAQISCPENAFRHSFISYRCAATGNVDQTSQEAGNTPKVVFRHYRELVSPQQGKAWFGVKPGS